MAKTLDEFWTDLTNITKGNVLALTLDELFALRRILISERHQAFGNGAYRRNLARKITLVETAICNLVPGAMTFRENCHYADLFLQHGDYPMAVRRYKMAGMSLHLKWLEMAKSGSVGDEQDEEVPLNIIPFDRVFDADARGVSR